jgi:NAD(P)-dependent dehydrogenase (short-subunit alcohol dehydrogenase family)
MPAPSSSAPRPAALVTGGALRIGRAIVLVLARAGYAVAIHANRSRADAEALRDGVLRLIVRERRLAVAIVGGGFPAAASGAG